MGDTHDGTGKDQRRCRAEGSEAEGDHGPVTKWWRRLSRRQFLTGVGVVGGAVAGAADDLATAVGPTFGGNGPAHAGVQGTSRPAGRELLESLTATEADALESFVERLIPSDENGPGAKEARVAHYIARALGGPLRSSRSAYASGLAALDAYSRATGGTSFAQLSAADQDGVLMDLESDKASGFHPDPSTFFHMVRAHAIQGMFCDPYYGGNAGYVGWDLIRYPGIRTFVTPSDQQIGSGPTVSRGSAYDIAMFSKAGSR